MRLGRASVRSGIPEDRRRAAEVFGLVYYEFPFSDVALEARSELDRLGRWSRVSRTRIPLTWAAERCPPRQCADAQSTFTRSSRMRSGMTRTRCPPTAEWEFFESNTASPEKRGGRLSTTKPRRVEARIYVSTLRELGLTHLRSAPIRRCQRDSSWAEYRTTWLCTTSETREDAASTRYGTLRGFAGGRYAERAGWKIGWRAYRTGRMRRLISYFERAAPQVVVRLSAII
jgi:hypothetical protein